MEYRQSSHSVAALDAAADAAQAHIASAGIHMTSAEKQKLAALENYDDSAILERISGLVPFGAGTLLTEPNADLFQLPVGKYCRVNGVSDVRNRPADLSSAFYCEVVNTIAANRRKIYLYPCTVQTAGICYTCLETGSGYGTWYKFTGEAVV